MRIEIMGTQLELTDAIKAYVNEKIGGLDKFFDNIIEARVEVGMTTHHHQKGDIFRAEVNLVVPKSFIRAEAVSDDLYKAINEAKEQLKIEINKYKDKLRGQ